LLAAHTRSDTLRTAAEKARTLSLRELDGSPEGDRDRLRVASAGLGQFAQGGDFLTQLLGGKSAGGRCTIGCQPSPKRAARRMACGV